MGNKPSFEVSGIADGVGGTRDIHILRKDKFDAADGHIAAGFPGMGGNCHGFQTALTFVALRIAINDAQTTRSTGGFDLYGYFSLLVMRSREPRRKACSTERRSIRSGA